VVDRACEWDEGRRVGSDREWSRGPFRRTAGLAELQPRAGGGSTLTLRVEVEPRGALGRLAARLLMGLLAGPALGRYYRRVGDGSARRRPGAGPKSGVVAGGWAKAMTRRGGDPRVWAEVMEFFATAPATARVRPSDLAGRLGLDPGSTAEACLVGVGEGVLGLCWEVVCQGCGAAAQRVGSLREVRPGLACGSCGLAPAADPTPLAELVVCPARGPHPAGSGVRVEGHPGDSPGVPAQSRVAQGGRARLGLALAPGAYRLRGVIPPAVIPFRVEGGAEARRLDAEVGAGLLIGGSATAGGVAPPLRPGAQVLEITNPTGRERVVRVERDGGPGGPVLTASGASALPLFRELLPGEVVAPGRFQRVASVALLACEPALTEGDYRALGDARAFALLDEQTRRVSERVRARGGRVVRTADGALLAAFDDPSAAALAATELEPALAGGDLTAGLRLKVGVHQGPALAGTQDGRPGYFGRTVSLTAALPARAGNAGGVILSAALADDPRVARALAAAGLRVTPLPVTPGEPPAYRVDRPPPTPD